MRLHNLLGSLALSRATVYFKETFDEGWENRWVKSERYVEEGSQGDWEWGTGSWYRNKKDDMGIVTSGDMKHFGITASFEPFSNEGKDLIMMYMVKMDEEVGCGGGYIKLGPPLDDPKNFSTDSPYYIMFGPDECEGEKQTHLILEHNGKYVPTKTKMHSNYESTHVGVTAIYKFYLYQNNSVFFQMDDDQAILCEGELRSEFNFLEAEQIEDPNDFKPDDWVDDPWIPDPEAQEKPEEWVDEARILDDTATKPDDWDDEEDGPWEAPMMDNPEYIGDWSPGMMPNPDYKGEWKAPMIDNPEFYDDDLLYKYDDIGYVGFDLWQVQAGVHFDNILITDDIYEADAMMEKWRKLSMRQVKKRDIAMAEEERRQADELEIERQRAAEEDASDMEES